jgi:hypothetical protein
MVTEVPPERPHAGPGAAPPPPARRLALPWTFGSGPDVAWTFQRAVALVFLLAWISLGAQVRLLIGARGLLPLANFIEAARAAGVLGLTSFPSWLVLASGDGTLVAGTVLGAGLALLAFAGVAPRACLAAQTFLYLGYAVGCRSFLGFQWDNLLLEAGTLAIFLPTSRAAPLAHLLFRALLFKLYFESGLAKWQSPIGDWRDGSAMTFYYETAPLPTALAWFAHNLPAGWHHFESWAALALELLVPFAFFGPRPARLAAGAAFTLFQIANAATANYGFFCYLAVALHLFLLDDRDVRALIAGRERFGRWLRGLGAAAVARRWRTRPWPAAGRLLLLVPWQGRARVALAVAGAVIWGVLSLGEGLFMFTGLDPTGAAARPLAALLEAAQPFRLVGTYHLFASVTRERIEPEVQVDDGASSPATDASPRWQPLAFHYKPGPVDRAPPLVAPHQPRVDFLLWFYGLSFRRRQPAYVAELLGRLCDDPGSVSALFAAPPPAHLRAVRIVFWDYRFTSPAERRATHAWWTRHELQTSPPVICRSSALPDDLPVAPPLP